MNLGQMECPNCGRIRGTDMGRCICGYNPLTREVEQIRVLPLIGSTDELYVPEICDLRTEKKIKPNDWEDVFRKFCIDANVNWIQYEILRTLEEFNLSESDFKHIDDYLKFGKQNKIHNGVPRLCQGNKVVDLSPTIKIKFNITFEHYPFWKKEVIRFVLLGMYDEAKTLIDKM